MSESTTSTHDQPSAHSRLEDTTRLPGLPGDNPLGLLAAVGALAALNAEGADYKLAWTEEPTPRAVLAPSVSLSDIAHVAYDVVDKWLAGPALKDIDPGLHVESHEIRDYLIRNREEGQSGVLAPCLLAEGYLQPTGTHKGKSKSSGLVFTTAQQKFVTIARDLLDNRNFINDVVRDLEKPWHNADSRDRLNLTLRWDSTGERLHAYSNADPTDHQQNPRVANPGAEALAVIGLSGYPCFATYGTLTPGSPGTGTPPGLAWPLWTTPATQATVRSLLSQVVNESTQTTRASWYRSWSITRIMRSDIRRIGSGGYGTFGPARVVWQRE